MKDSTPSCAVLLAAYNGEAYIGEQIGTILTQRSVEPQIFIRLDPSTDRTQEVVDSLIQNEPRIRQVIDESPSPAGAAQNFYRLILKVELGSDVQFVALADQDDVWYPDKLLRALAALDQADAYSSDVDIWDNATGKRAKVHKSHPQREWDHLFSSAGPGCTYVLRRETFDAFRQWLRDHWTEVMAVDYHDWLIYAWARTNGQTWIIDPHASMAYRQHANNQLGANRGLAAALRRVAQIRSGWYLDQARLIAHILQVEGAPPVDALRSWSTRDRWRLIRQARHLRRSRADQVGIVLALALSPQRSASGACYGNRDKSIGRPGETTGPQT